MNIIERIIAQKTGKETVKAGDELCVPVDLAIAHDVTGPMAIEQFRKIGAEKVFDKDKVVFVIDHNIPSSSVDSRLQHNSLKSFYKDMGIKLYHQGDGVIHQLAAEKALYKEGDIVVGADSHTCTAGAFGAVAIPVGATELAAVMALGTIDIEVPQTYLIEVEGHLNPGVYAKDVILYLIGKFGTHGFTDKAVIFGGNTITNMSFDEKMTISNMAIEMGAMIGYVNQGEPIGEVEATYRIQASDIQPQVACPYSPGNVKPVKDVEGTPITQVVIGSCTNGRVQDMEIAAEVLKGKKISDMVTMIVVPASKKVIEQMDHKGITKIFRDAGAIVVNPGCGPCFGAHQGLLSEDDIAVSTTNRNFPGRMGHNKAKVYLASPRTAAESAIAGYIVSPGSVLPWRDDCEKS
ncbi:3-isopropylmalate dehydratase large subunit 1 [Tepidanaerobacter acetatoxydans Re1]|uniref:3-isopropylmalate dehydratase large subunit 1 n=1 Tax=Tepidanaerobacter acetatoxydans (strain DSM 21804 / JCM 16047 / Re1) TaxID=1209989 RepID=F4LUN3_TEPAE|nr:MULTISPECIES: aconitase/3-isopropylmalate dehydratase large subunit family protein [Tepidanaerobacter]AEE90601.1 3-isopropylmalate dehydratase [Tepidanaerobacter acetatoxydans Re1]CCP25122.1 3-isopropylmalate dehydratase large subunit 1 [Tepidanaerobacter acetatoxydans Re1]